MKTIAISLFLFSTVTFGMSCPDISGNFTCKSTTTVSNKEIVPTDYGFQINSDGIIMNVIPDGIEYSLPATEDYKDAKMQSYCQNDQLVVSFNATLIYQGSEMAKQSSKTSYFMKDDQLIIQEKMKLKNSPMPMVFYTCTRN